jgi:SagB-type dehydrogenase family enzyme
MTNRFLVVQLVPEVRLERSADRIAVQMPGRSWGIRRSSEEIVQALERLEQGDATVGELEELASGPLGWGNPLGWRFCLDQLLGKGLVRFAATAGGIVLATLTPLTPQFTLRPFPDTPEQRFILSRFAYLRRDGAKLVLESPCSHGRVAVLDPRAVAVLALLTGSQTAEELRSLAAVLPAEGTASLLELLWGAGMAVGPEEEDAKPSLAQWEFHDLLFHARSRAGRHDAALGGTYRFAGRLDPPPALKAPMSTDAIDLDKPDLERLAREDPPLTLVQERRRSVRRYGATPLSVRQLGEFLYRVGRVKECRQVEVPLPSGAVPMDFASRPYPGGGALYELELYITVNACAGLERGLYHYDPQHHRLERLAAAAADIETLLAGAAAATGIPKEGLQVLITLAARFARIGWKYASMAYALILKHVGVLYQTMYLVGTAMDLAPCGVGSGNSDCFARAAGTDYYAETSVGEFLLGSKP